MNTGTLKTGKEALKVIFIMTFLLVCCVAPAKAQTTSTSNDKAPPSKIFEVKPQALNATTIISGNTEIKIWGIQAVEGISPSFNLKVRTALENAIAGKTIQCELKKRTQAEILAQCINSNDMDLGLFMIQQGYVAADRGAVYGTVFEGAYIQAENEAQDRGLGIWADEGGEDVHAATSGKFMLGFGFVIFLAVIATFTALSIIIMRGFQKVVEAQNDSMEMMGKERRLRDQERRIFAVMLDSEIKANKAKIEAFLVVYDEMLKALKDPNRPPKYKKAGDIVQKQPALQRSVFDRNTDKLDILGPVLSSDVIHFYARIKSKPEYENLEPETKLKDAMILLEGVLGSAQRLDKQADKLIDAFRDSGMSEY